jgi:hypothetical protein
MEVPMPAKSWNWRLWVGFVLCPLALWAFFHFFEDTRAVFWPSLLLFLIAAFLLISGLKRAFGEPQAYRGKVFGSILAGLSVVLLGLFGYMSYQVYTHFPAAKNAPQVGRPAPQFALLDSNGKNVSLGQLLSNPKTDSTGAARALKGVLIVFYRGYW